MMINYEEKYKRALDNFRKIKADNKNNKELVDFIEDEYPELKEENEDEKIRRKLINALKECGFTHFNDEFTVQEALAWLEKRGEQKTIWSEEDEKFLNLSLVNLTELKDRFGEEYDKVGDCIDWLNSLKERMKGE